jgi:3-oxoacyl-[acyl-carrier-protein] synthase-3
MLFSDAGVATLITADKTKGVGNFVFGTDGSGANMLMVRASGDRPLVNEGLEEMSRERDGLTLGRMSMDGMGVFTFSIRVVPGLIHDVLLKNNLCLHDIDLFIFHQANGFMLEMLRKKIGIPKEKFYTFLEETGNTVASSIPISMAEAIKNNRIQKGSKVLIAGFGIGFSWAASIVEF